MKDLNFEEHDGLNRQRFMQVLTSLIEQELKLADDGLVISLNGGFGSGKTQFLNMWRNQIALDNEAEKEIEEQSQLEVDPNKLDFQHIVLLNAWEEDFAGNPLLSIISAIVRNAEKSDDSAFANELKESVKDLSWFLLALSNGIAARWTGANPVEAGKLASDKKQQRNDEGVNGKLIDEHINRVNQLTAFKTFLAQHYSIERPALILVDELDRCRPNYAIEYIEVINHLFGVPGIVFVLAVDRDQLESSAKSMFGRDLNFDDYYLKFVDFELALPSPAPTTLNNYIESRIDYFFRNIGRKTGISIKESVVATRISALMDAFDLKPRQIERALRLGGYLFSVNREGEKINQAYCFGVVFLIALKMTKPDSYRIFVYGPATYKQIIEIFDKANFATLDDLQWWKLLCLAGRALPLFTESNEIIDLGRLGINDSEAVQEVARLRKFWGHHQNKDHNHFIKLQKIVEIAKKLIE